MLTMRTGEVVDDVERNRRMAEAKFSGEHNFYMMEMGPGLIIDARTKYDYPFYDQLMGFSQNQDYDQGILTSWSLRDKFSVPGMPHKVTKPKGTFCHQKGLVFPENTAVSLSEPEWPFLYSQALSSQVVLHERQLLDNISYCMSGMLSHALLHAVGGPWRASSTPHVRPIARRRSGTMPLQGKSEWASLPPRT